MTTKNQISAGFSILVLLTLLTACSTERPIAVQETESFEAVGMIAGTLPEITEALGNGEISSEELVQLYLDRINRIDRSGPHLQAVLSLNPRALDEAKELDRLRKAGTIIGLLHGIPILIKDNIESKEPVPTTAGALALRENMTLRDSPLVTGLREQGAIILGKTNLSQWANFRSEASMSGWSALGGQVRNPHMLDRNPCGSSSGSGVAAAASLAAGTVGTETNGSIICPSNVNGIVGFKPTVGLVPQQYIIPISSTQDTAGPMTKSVKGAAMMLSAMATTNDIDYAAALDAQSLDGVRVGILRYAEGENSNIIRKFNEALNAIEAAGATLVEIKKNPLSGKGLGPRPFALMKYEFKAGLNDYLESTPDSVETRTLAELIDYNEAHSARELALFDQSIFIDSEKMGSLDDPAYIKAREAVLKTNREEGIDFLLAEHDVEVLVSPSGALASRVDPVNGDVWPAWAGAGSMAARAGYPHATVPMGTYREIPIGISFIGGKDQDAKVLSFAYAYEQATKLRASPKYYRGAEEIPEIAEAMNALEE